MSTHDWGHLHSTGDYLFPHVTTFPQQWDSKIETIECLCFVDYVVRRQNADHGNMFIPPACCWSRALSCWRGPSCVRASSTLPSSAMPTCLNSSWMDTHPISIRWGAMDWNVLYTVGFNCASTHSFLYHSGTELIDDDGCVSCCQMEPSQILDQARQFLLRTISQTRPTALSSSQYSQVDYVTSNVMCEAVHLYF